MPRATLFLVTFLLVAATGFAGSKDLRSVKPQRLIIDDGIEHVATPGQGRYIAGLDNPTSLNWVIVDSMSNAFGPADNRARSIVYDPATDVLALIHRGDASYGASGQLWYNMSRDAGLTWRRVGELNGGSATTCRYPSCAISNPANNSDTSQCLFVYAAPNLEFAPNTWGLYTYGLDYPLGGGVGSGTVDNNNMGDNSASAEIWGVPSSDWVNWAATTATTTGGPNDGRSWRTNDWVTVTTATPPTWTDAAPNFINAIAHITGLATSQACYYAMQGLFDGDTLIAYETGNPFNGGFSKSTNNGATWSQWIRPSPDWMTATGLRRGYDLFDYVQPPGGTVSWNSDFSIDGNERAHFFHVVVDSPWTEHDPRGILEVYETGANVWSYKWVTQSLNTYTGLGYPGVVSGTAYLDQTNNAVTASISSDGQVLGLVWLDAATMAPADSFPDIWFSFRRIDGTAWSTPVNLTQTPGFAELLLHTSPIMRSNGGNSYTMFIGRSYQSGITSYPPDNGLKTTYFVAPYTFTTTGVAETGQQPASFKLEQNYPNPFNPTTSVRYTVASGGLVTLKVYNTLGQEVATLVNGNVAPGEHIATFDATRLSTGVYIYKLTSGNNVETRKMVLLK